MAKITYTNSRGDSIELGQTAPFYVTKLEGFSDVENIISTYQAYKQDGTSITNDNLDGRHLVIQGEYLLDRQEGRNRLIRAFNPKLNGILKYENGNTIKEINCKPERTPIISSTNKATIPYLINLYANDPFWLDEYDLSEEVVTWIGGMKFPLVLPTRFAMAGDKVINIVNSGDVDTPIKLEIYGPASNPKILKRDTGEFIKINRKLLNGEVMTITTEFGNKRVEIDGINVFNYINYESTFFNLDVGDNVIELLTDDVSDNANIKITYRNRYIGV